MADQVTPPDYDPHIRQWFASATIVESWYMGTSSRYPDQRLVFAKSENEARDKYIKFWSEKTSEYSVYYRVEDLDLRSPIY